MIELKANAAKARKDIAIDALAISVNESFPQFDAQSSTLVAAEEDADIRRYASICISTCKNKRPTSDHIYNEQQQD